MRKIPGFVFVIPFAVVTTLGGATPSKADLRPQNVQDSVEVSLVEVPVTVVGRNGQPVRGLTKENFILEEDGRRRPIESFDVADLSRKATPGREPIPAAARRHLLFLFDLSFANPRSIVRAEEAALRYIRKGVDPSDLAGVAVTSVETGAKLLLAFTSDRRQLEEAIKRVGLPTLIDRERDPLAFAFVPVFSPNIISMPQGNDAEKPGSPQDQAIFSKVVAAMGRRSADAFSITRVERQLVGMGSLAKALDMVEGRKTILYFSEGFDSSLLSGSTGDSMEDTKFANEAMFHGMTWTIDVDKRYANSSLQRQMSDMVTLFRRSDCIVYAVNIAGLSAEGKEASGLLPARGQDALFAIADGTGGALMENGNSFDEQLERVDRATSVTYVLTFRPGSARGDGEFHRLQVRTTVPGTRVSSRTGYYDRGGFRELTPLERTLAAGGLVMGRNDPGTLGIHVMAMPMPGKGINEVPVLVQIPESAVREEGGETSLGVYIYVMDSTGSLADFVVRSIRVRPPSSAGARSSEGFVFSGICHLASGTFDVRVLVRNEHTGAFGFRRYPLTIDDSTGTRPVALPPIFLSENGPPSTLADAGTDRTALFMIGETPFSPAIDPQLDPRLESRVCLIFVDPSESEVRPFDVQAEVADSTGAPVGPARVSVLGRTSRDARGLVKVLVRFLPSDLASGAYTLRVTFRDHADPGLTSSSESPFRVL